MGAAIVERMLDAAISVRIWNRSPHRLHPLAQKGAIISGDIAELIANSGIILVCLSDGASVREVFDRVYCSGEESPRLLINLGTVGPRASCELSGFLTARGFQYLDLPVSGGPEGARAGSLTAYLGDAEHAAEDVRALIGTFSSRVVECSLNAQAQRMKVLNNLCEAVNLWGAAEAYALGRAVGFSDDALREGLPAGRGDSRYLRVLLDYVKSPPETADVSLSIRCKDLDLAAELVPEECRQPVLLSQIRRLFARASAEVGALEDQCRCLDVVEAGLVPAEEPHRVAEEEQ
jgi:3-hydroxyisobutyrate dehydrogenase